MAVVLESLVWPKDKKFTQSGNGEHDKVTGISQNVLDRQFEQCISDEYVVVECKHLFGNGKDLEGMKITHVIRMVAIPKNVAKLRF
ncbi:MAG: hypothetical protein R2932_00450 [Caldilineaceae bacterium]